MATRSGQSSRANVVFFHRSTKGLVTSGSSMIHTQEREEEGK